MNPETMSLEQVQSAIARLRQEAKANTDDPRVQQTLTQLLAFAEQLKKEARQPRTIRAN